ncbi:MAG TPA: hypothetical protein DD435_04700 [Cyanobacteria bacterium UBA8530]|nr:hypothetical protein [Cyanobacteria bacterium UBA8530]
MAPNPVGDQAPLIRLPLQTNPLPPQPPEIIENRAEAPPLDRLDLSQKGSAPQAAGGSFVGIVLAKTTDVLKGLVISAAAWIMDALPFLKEEKVTKAMTSFDNLRKKYGNDPEWKKLEALATVPTILTTTTTRASLAASDARIDELQTKLSDLQVKKTQVAMESVGAAPSQSTLDSLQKNLATELAKRESLFTSPPADPQLKAIWDKLEVGDVMLTAAGPNSPVGLLTAGDEVTHAALCVKKGPPPVFIEAVGLSGDLKNPNSNKVREADFWTFFEGTEKKEENPVRYPYHIIKPNYGSTPAEQEKNLSKVLGYAKEQLGKPYDYFFDGTDSRAFFCSELVRKAFEETNIVLSPEVSADPAKEQKQAAIAQGIQDSLKYLSEKYKLSEQDLFELGTNPTKLTEMMTVEILGMANDDNSYGNFLQNFDRLMANLGPFIQNEAREQLTGMSGFIRHIAKSGAFDRKNLSEILDFGLSRVGAAIPPGALRTFILGKGSEEIRAQSGLIHSGNNEIASDATIEGMGKETARGNRQRSTSPQDLAFLRTDAKNVLANLLIKPDGTMLNA